MNEINNLNYEAIFYPLVIICALPWVISAIYGVRVIVAVFKEKPEALAEWNIRVRIRILKELENTSADYARAKKKTIRWMIATVVTWVSVFAVLSVIAYTHSN